MKIEWQEKAKLALRKQTIYCLQKFGRNTAIHFRENISKIQELLETFPRMGKIEQELAIQGYEYRSFVVHEHFKIIYRLDEEKDVVYIIHFWDVRREPRKLAEDVELNR